MKKIILVRHASAVGHVPDGGDFDRSLRKKGRNEAKTMAAWYAGVAELPSLLVSSPANRAIETAYIFAKEFGYPKKKIIQDEALYGGLDATDFLTILKTLDDKHRSVMVFGHDPSFSEFAQFINKGFEQYLPKCSVFGVTTNRRSWMTIRRGDGRLDIFEHPAGLRQRQDLAEAVRDEMVSRIEGGIVTAIGEFGVKAEEKDRAKIRRVSAKLAKIFAARTISGRPLFEKRKADQTKDEA